MQNESKKPSRTARVFNTFFPYKKAAQAAMRPAVDGLEITRDLLDRLKAEIRPTPRHAAPESFADAQALWREAVTRHALDAQQIQTIQNSLDYTWLALFFTGVVAAATGIAGLILIFLNGFFPAVGQAAGLLVAFGASSLLLRINIRRSQVRARALVSWPQYLQAAGGLLPAIFSDVHLTAAVVDEE